MKALIRSSDVKKMEPIMFYEGINTKVFRRSITFAIAVVITSRSSSSGIPYQYMQYMQARREMPFTFVVNVYSDMSLSKGHLGSRGESIKNKLKDTSFIFPMTNILILGVFRMHAQKEYGKVLEMKSTYT